MNLGSLSLWVSLIASLAATVAFLRRKNQANWLFIAASVATLAASGFLLDVILTHQFAYAYVAKYTSLTQPLLYQISAFWAGQEGTFLLWALLTAIMGYLFLKKSQEDRAAMAIVSGFLAFLNLLLIVRSPFAVTATAPADGTGMNPLLMDPWMVIHPPILFLGYAATLFPFAIIVSGLARRDYRHWFASGFTWTVFSAAALGAGIIIGGFWAYEVLGWGGYWGWDPVENSSLVPWLALLALIHGLLIQRAKGGLVRTNMFLGIFSFVLVLYATFLTRSGVLSDFSVHSFVDLGINNYLVGILVATTTLGLGFFLTRFREIRSPRIELSGINRELALVLSLAVLTLIGVFTFFGMSSPILTGFFGKASQVEPSFYNRVNLPVAIAMALLLGVTPFLGWSEEKKAGILKRLSMPLALTVLACLIALVAGVKTFGLMMFVGSAAFGLISNVIIAFRQYRSGWTGLGGPIAHIGVGLLLIGIVGSGSFDTTQQVVLAPNQPQHVGGYQLTFRGIDELQAAKPRVKIEVSDGKSLYLATPKLYWSEYNQAMMREPDIRIYPLGDLYISPLELHEPPAPRESMVEISKGESKDVAGYHITFTRFDVGQHGEQAGAMSVGAVLEVTADGKTSEVLPLLTFMPTGERQTTPADLPILGSGQAAGSKPQIALNAISVEEHKVLIQVLGVGNTGHPDAAASLIVEVSTKPLMMVVWTGVVLILGGLVISLRHRAVQSKNARTAAPGNGHQAERSPGAFSRIEGVDKVLTKDEASMSS